MFGSLYILKRKMLLTAHFIALIPCFGAVLDKTRREEKFLELSQSLTSGECNPSWRRRQLLFSDSSCLPLKYHSSPSAISEAELFSPSH